MTVRTALVEVRVLPQPNGDLAVDDERRVYKLTAAGWKRLEYVIPEGCRCGWASPTNGVRVGIAVGQ